MLEEEYRKRLDKILRNMAEQNRPRDEMQLVVDDFKSIYDPKAITNTQDFKYWYADRAAITKTPENPDDPKQFYNYRAAYLSGAEPELGPDNEYRWPSKFKKEGHPDLIIDGVDTRTGQPPDWDMFVNPVKPFEEFQKTALAQKRSAQVTAAPTQTMEVPVENVRTEQMQLEGAGKQPEIMPPMDVTAGDIQRPFTGDVKEAVKAFARNMITGPRAMQEMANERSFKELVDKQKQLDELIARKTDVGLTPQDEKVVLRLGKQIDRETKQLQGNQKITDWLGRIEKTDLLKAKEVERLEGPAGFLQDVTQGLVQLGGQFLARAVNPSLGAAAIAGQISGNTIATLEEYGVNKEEAVPLAILNSVVQYPLEKLGMGKIAKNVLRNSAPVLRKMISSFVSEGSTEGIQQIPDEILGQMWGETKGQTIEERAQYLKDNIGDLLKSAGYAGLVGGVIGSTATGIGRAGAKAAGVKDETIPPETPAVPVEPTPPPAPAEQATQFTPAPTAPAATETAMPTPEAETIKMPVVKPEGAKVVTKSAGITQTYVPGEQGSIIPPKTTEAANVQQEKEGVQVEPASFEPVRSAEFGNLTEEEKIKHYAALEKEAYHDGLTGLINRKGLARENVDITTAPQIITDLDNFKTINDEFGHPVGDEVLKTYASILQKHFGENARIVRIGGEEIAIFPLKSIDAKDILKIEKTANQELASQVFADGKLTGVTFSAGNGVGFKQADEQLYNAKNSGRSGISIEGKFYGYEGNRPGSGLWTEQVRLRTSGKNDNRPAAAATEAAQPAPAQEVTPQEKAPPSEEPPAAPAAETVVKPTPPPKTPAPEAKKPPQEPTVKNQLKAILTDVFAEEKAREKAAAKATGKLPKAMRKSVTIKSSKQLPKDSKKLLDENGEWEAAVWYNPENKVIEVHINENLAPEKYAEVLYHEIPGHIGQRLVFADSPALLNSMRQMYGAAKTRKDVDLEAIRKAYKADIEKAGENGDDLLFEEWTAHNLHRYLIQNDRASLPTRIYNMFRAALVKIGVVKAKIDDVLRSMIKQMSKAKDIGVLEGKLEKSFMRPVPEGGKRIYDLESAKAIAEEYGVEYSGSEPAPGGPNYLFTDKKTGTQFKANSRDELAKAVADLSERIAPKGTVKPGPDIRYKRPLEQPNPSETQSVSPGVVNLDINDETKYQAFRRWATDRYYRLRTLTEAAEKQTGEKVSDDLDAYVKQDIIHSKIKDKIDTIQKNFIDRIADIAKEAKLSVKEIDDYLYLLHAEETDRVVGKRRPDMVKEGIPPSGLSMARRKEITDQVEKSGKKADLDKISAIVQEWNNAKLDMMVEDGILSKEQKKQFQDDYKNYVPLKGIPDEEGNDVVTERPRTGKGYSVAGAENKMRKGRTSEAQNILAHLAADTAEKAVRGEKNKVTRALYEFSKKYKNDLILTEPVIIKKVFDKKSGTFKDKKVSDFEVSLSQRYGTPLAFKVDGKEMQMLIKDEPLMRAMTNMGSEQGEGFTRVLTKVILPVQRYLALVRTQLSLNFIPSNALRDTMTAQLNAIGLNLPEEKQKGLALEILKSVPKSVGWAYQGQKDMNTEGAKAYKDFVKNGGAIEFLGMQDIEHTQKRLEEQINTMRPGAIAQIKKLGRTSYDYITLLNGAVENANRLATYTALVKRGVSKQQAAYIAKNITVNFNRKGEVGSFLNAWALFANAGIQGSVRLLKTLKDSPTVRRIAGGVVLSSLAHAELMRMLAGDDPEDKENYYDKISDFTRDTHLLVPLGKLTGKETKNYIRVPLPYGYNIFWAMGQHISRVIHGGVDKIPEESLHLIGAAADAFNPIGGSVDLTDPKSVVRNFTPTIAQPFAEIAVNQNFMGGPVYKELTKAYGPQPVAAHSSLKSTPAAYKAVAEWANDLTGGGAYRPGVVNMSPDIMKHIVEFGTGGVGKLGTDLISAPFDWISNKKIPAKEIPLVQRFYGEINEYKDVKSLYDNMEKVQRIYKDFEQYKKDDPEKAKKLQRQYPAAISMFRPHEGMVATKEGKMRTAKVVSMNKLVVKRLRTMNERRKEMEERGNKEAVKRIEKNIVDHAQLWNARLEKMLKPLPIKKSTEER